MKEAGGGYTEKYGLVQGECRTLAWAYIECQTGEPQRVRAVVEKLTLDQAFSHALIENLDRDDMNPLDLAAAFLELLTTRINPATTKSVLEDGTPNPLYSEKHPTGRPYTLKEIALMVGREYQWVRSRALLVHLSDRQKRQVEANWKAGKRDITAYCKKAAANKAGRAAGEDEEGEVTVTPETRRRVLSLKAVVGLFDATPLENTERLGALAEVMGATLATALAERQNRESAKKAG